MIDGHDIILGNQKIGDGWASFHYEQLINQYNAFYIADVTPIKLDKSNLIKRQIVVGKNYIDILSKDYILVKVYVYNTDLVNDYIYNIFGEKSWGQSIIEMDYTSLIDPDTRNVKELNLIFEKNNYENYQVCTAHLTVNIFLNCLSESNVFLDDTINTFSMLDSERSESIIDYLYYSAVVIMTWEFGDIVPLSLQIRIMTIIEAFLGLLVMGFFLAKAFERK